MKTASIFKFALLAAVAVSLVGCSTAKRVSYLLDMEYGQAYNAGTAPELRIQKEDVLRIKVFCDEPQLAQPFFLSSVDGSEKTYEVDSLGMIEFPVLGMVKAEDLTVEALEDKMEALIKETGYIKDPKVEADITNFKVTVLGAVGNKEFLIDGDKCNIIQLLAMAGSPSEECNLADVMVIRTENGLRTPYQVNLQTKDLYDSPVFYLKQNDVVYFKPKGLRMTTSGDALLKVISPGLSLASIITNFLLWSTRR